VDEVRTASSRIGEGTLSLVVPAVVLYDGAPENIVNTKG
jgi:hypothetical protein